MEQIQPHQQRMLDEQNELVERMNKLKEFIDESSIFQGLSIEDQLDLRTQYYYMVKYSNALQERIDKQGL